MDASREKDQEYLAASFRHPEDLEQADTASRRALELEPELAEAHASRGVTLSLRARHEEAEQAFETAIRLDPQLFEAHYFYARDAFARGDLEKAIRQYEEAIRIRPEDYQSRGLEWADRALTLDPEDPMLLYNIACIKAMAGAGDAALDCLERRNASLALNQDPSSRRASFSPGRRRSPERGFGVRTRRGSAEVADPSSPCLTGLLGVTCHGSGRPAFRRS